MTTTQYSKVPFIMTLNCFLITTLLLILFVVIGLCGLINQTTTQSDKPILHALWFLIPSIPIALYYSYRSTFGYKKGTALWQNILGTMALTLFFSLLLIKSFQGYLITYNGAFGRQQPFLLKGQITRVDAPRRKGRLFSQYTIEVLIDSSRQTVRLDTKSNTFKVGQYFEEELVIGSLGYIYSPY